MAFNMKKYDNVRFHSDDLTHKRIKALLLWFEYEVYKRNANLDTQIVLLDKWINTLVTQEYYEVVPFFKNMRLDMMNKKPEEVTDNVTEEEQKVSFLTSLFSKIKNLIGLKKRK